MKKGFTLIELLIVIGILAVLATATVLVLNPAQLFAQARDSQRLSDLGALKSAVSYYLSTASAPAMVAPAADGVCGTNFWGTVDLATENFTGSPTQSTQTARSTGGLGWLPINLGDSSGGSPLSVLPIDPVNPNTATQSYTYQCNAAAKTYEIDAVMESTRYTTAPDDVQGPDGGDKAAVYEVGNDPGLDL